MGNHDSYSDSIIVGSIYFLLAITDRPARRIRPTTKILALGRFGFPKAHVGTHVPAVRFAPRHIPLSGAMSFLPSCVREYSTEMAFDFVTGFAINPADSRLRRVLVSMRCETLPR
jgi:hypothetical protein